MDTGEIALSNLEFMRIQRRVHDVAGIALSDGKRTLVVARLSKVLRALRLQTFTAYLDYLERDGTGADQQAFINALTTNLTRFWREEHHFTHLIAQMPKLMAALGRAPTGLRPRLRIWSAGCSTGQEPYTIAMSVLGAFPKLADWDFRILATDIDTNAIADAEDGIYSRSELDGLSREQLRRFVRLPDGSVQVPEAARRLVTFKALNLMAPWPMRGSFDAIFCRNVAIYFDRPIQTELFGRLGAMLAPAGYLYIGHSETIPDLDAFASVGTTIYQRRQPHRSAA